MIKMLDINKVKANFPFESFRKHQDTTIEGIVESFNSGNKLVILEAPVGSGKSPVNVALARSFNRSYIVTTQKILQDQYLNDFDDLVTIKGRNNYPCIAEEGMNCSTGMCQIDRNYKCNIKENCAYNVAKEKAVVADKTVFNTAYTFFADRRAFGKRDLLILDEAHNIDVLASDMVSCTINLKMFDETIPIYETAQEYAEYFDELIEKIREYTNSNRRKYKSSKKKVYISNMKRGERLITKIKLFIADVEAGNDWVFDRNQQYQKIKFQPVTIGRFLRTMIWDLADKFIISSGTIIDGAMFMEEAGLTFCSGKANWLKVPMTFPIKNRQIYSIPSGKMSRKYKATSIEKVSHNIEVILRKHDGENVLVHCNSYENAKVLAEMVNAGDRPVIIQQEGKRDFALDQFLNSTNAVYLSVKMTEGLDLLYDKGRVNIIAKVPFPFLGDVRIKKRLDSENGNKWYKWKTVLEICQAYGRTNRADDDFSTTYILDSDFGYLYNTAKDMIPKWFSEAINWKVRDIDPSQNEIITTIYKIVNSLDRVYGDFTLPEVMRSVEERKDGYTEEQVVMAIKALKADAKIFKWKPKRWKVV